MPRILNDTLGGAKPAFTSEESLIQGYLAPLAAGMPGAFGLADDCAALTPPTGFDLVVKTDPITAGIHFLPDDAPEDVAFKAVAVNASDIIAKGAAPWAYLMALSLPLAPTADWARRFAQGLAEAQTAFDCVLVGGDTDRGPGALTVSVTMLGLVPTGRMVRRGTARAGDVILVGPGLGDAVLGLRLRTGALDASRLGLTPGETSALVAHSVRPKPDLRHALPIRSHASASMDVSDGLVKDLGRLCMASGVGAQVRATDLRFSAGAQKALAAAPDLLPVVLTGGDDYVPLVTVPPTAVDAFLAAAALTGDWSRIGEITSGVGVTVLDHAGQPISFTQTGWDHLA